MRLIYLTSSRLPTEKAYGYQILKECETLADAGASVQLFSPALAQKQARAMEVSGSFDLHSYYQVRRNFGYVPLPVGLWLDPFWTETSRLWAVAKMLAYTIGIESLLRKNVGAGPSILWTQDLLVAATLLRRIYGRPWNVVYECHGVPMGALRQLLPRLNRALAIVATTRGIQNYLTTSGVDAKRIMLAPNAVDFVRFQIPLTRAECRQRLGLPPDRKIIGYIGKFRTYDMEKGIPELIRSMGVLVHSIDPPPILLCVGGPLDRVGSYLEIGAANGVAPELMRFEDFRPRAEVPLWMKACDVCTIPFPGSVEHFAKYASPMKAFEYMAAGVPIVASDIPALSEILTHGETAVLVSSLDRDTLAAGLLHVLGDEEFGQRLAARALEAVRENSWERRAARMMEFVLSRMQY
jgi:glycosyltransferase involved in cell wall biosynthesis